MPVGLLLALWCVVLMWWTPHVIRNAKTKGIRRTSAGSDPLAEPAPRADAAPADHRRRAQQWPAATGRADGCVANGTRPRTSVGWLRIRIWPAPAVRPSSSPSFEQAAALNAGRALFSRSEHRRRTLGAARWPARSGTAAGDGPSCRARTRPPRTSVARRGRHRGRRPSRNLKRRRGQSISPSPGPPSARGLPVRGAPRRSGGSRQPSRRRIERRFGGVSPRAGDGRACPVHRDCGQSTHRERLPGTAPCIACWFGIRVCAAISRAGIKQPSDAYCARVNTSAIAATDAAAAPAGSSPPPPAASIRRHASPIADAVSRQLPACHQHRPSLTRAPPSFPSIPNPAPRTGSQHQPRAPPSARSRLATPRSTTSACSSMVRAERRLLAGTAPTLAGRALQPARFSCHITSSAARPLPTSLDSQHHSG
jgi:hypothetical protein